MKEYIYLQFPYPPDANMISRLKSAGWSWRPDDGRCWRALDDGASRDIHDDEGAIQFSYFPVPLKTHKVGLSQTMRLWCGNVARGMERPYPEARRRARGQAVVALHLNIPGKWLTEMISQEVDLMFAGKTIRVHLQSPNTNLHYPKKADIKKHQVHFLVWEHAADDYEIMGYIEAGKAYRLAEKNQGQWTVEARQLADANSKYEVNIWL